MKVPWNGIYIYICLVAVLRIFISILPGYQFDQNQFFLWSERLAEVGSAKFYFADIPTNNPIGFLYFLWPIGLITNFLSNFLQIDMWLVYILHKLPANIADILSGILIFSLLKEKIGIRPANIAFLIYTLNPALMFNSVVWGQYDGLATFFLLISVYMITKFKAYEISSLSFALALSLKPQVIALAPFLGLIIIVKSSPIRLLMSIATFILISISLYLPFFPTNPLNGFIFVNGQSFGSYNCTTCFAFNFWGIFGHAFGKTDLDIFLGFPLLYWSLSLVIISWLVIFFYNSFKLKFKIPLLYVTATISLMAFFILLTRMHERYIYPVFPFLLLSAFMLRSKLLIGIFALLSIQYFVNLFAAYASANTNLALTPYLVNTVLNYFSIFSLINVALFILTFTYFIKLIGTNK